MEENNHLLLILSVHTALLFATYTIFINIFIISEIF